MGDSGPRTLAIDVGGTGLKAVVLDPEGEMISERVRVETPYPCPPSVLLDELDKLAKTQPEYDRVSVGFPGAIRRGRPVEVMAGAGATVTLIRRDITGGSCGTWS